MEGGLSQIWSHVIITYETAILVENSLALILMTMLKMHDHV